MTTVFETIKDRLPITEVLSSYITVEQSGSQYKAKCPFHNERTASFYISADRGLYYCFGCGAKGDIFTFVEQFEGLDRKGALKLLAERAGVVLTGSDSAYSDTDPVYEVLEKTALRYQDVLSKNISAQEYLTKRGLTKETVDTFRIGYAPDEWRFVENTCKENKDKQIALRAGLLKQTEGLPAMPAHAGQAGKIYDRFRKRIMFPMADSSGRIIGFSGRAFPDDGDGPKYLNSPETELFQKSKTLFGFDKAKFHIKKHNFAILVEGQMDLVLSHQYGFRNTVASSGTAVSEDAATDPFSNLSVLSRLTPHLFLAFDGDEAGQKAMDRAALVALSLGMNPKVVSLPEGVDPADFIRDNGTEAWKECLKNSKHFIEHHLDLIRKQTQSPHLFVKNIKDKLFPFLARVASPMEKNIYINMISKETGMPSDVILQELANVSKGVVSTVEVLKKDSLKESSPYERLTALRKKFSSEAIEQVADLLNSLVIGDIVFSALPVSEDRLNQALIVVEEEYGSLSDIDRVKVARELVDKLIDMFLANASHEYSLALKKAESSGDEEEINKYTDLLNQIHKRRHERSSSA